MTFVQVTEALKERGLEYPNLSVLQANEELYTVLLVQPQAEIYVSTTEIRNLKVNDAQSLSIGAMSLANELSVELLVLPEYCVPWQAVETVMKANKGPANGQIWVLGCESISITDALRLEQRFARYAMVFHEPIDSAHVEPSTAAYFNPVIYLFRSRMKVDQTEKLVMLVQFKIHPSGDPSNTEVTSMAKGKWIYLFEGPRAEIRLTTLVCSDVLALQHADITQSYEDTLFLHIQLNDNPRSSSYSKYKRFLFESRCDRTELICLNWAERIKFYFEDGIPPVQKINIAGSTWHTRSEQVDTKDNRIESNHNAGLYYTRNEKEKCHVLHFSYKPSAFLVHATKVKHTGVIAEQSYRRGPELLKTFIWNPTQMQWQHRVNNIDDGFTTYSSGYTTAGPQLRSAHAKSPLAAERIVELTGGEFNPTKDWYKADKLNTARINTDEIVKRITVTQDPEGEIARNEGMSKVQGLADLVGHIPFIHPLEDIKAGFTFVWTDRYPYCNVMPIGQNTEPATIIFAGVGKRQDELAGMYAKVSKLVQYGENPDRFGVVYQEGIKAKLYFPVLRNSISRTFPIGNCITEPEK